MPFEKGHKHGAKSRLFDGALKRAIAQDDGKRLRAAAEKLLDLASEGEPWAVRELADRLDGKSIAAVEVTDSRDIKDLTTNELLALVAAERARGEGERTGDSGAVH